MPYYDTDNLTCWITSMTQEHIDYLDEDSDRIEFVKTHLEDATALSNWVYESLEEWDIVKNDNLRMAIINSIEWYDVWRELLDDNNEYQDDEQSYVCHHCQKAYNATKAEREKWDPFCQECDKLDEMGELIKSNSDSDEENSDD